MLDIRIATNGDLLVERADWARNVAGFEDWTTWRVAGADQMPRGGWCWRGLAGAQHSEAGWAIWGDAAKSDQTRRLYILDYRNREIVNPDGVALPPEAIDPPDVVGCGGSRLAVMSDHRMEGAADRLLRHVLLIDTGTAQCVGRFQIEGVDAHLLSPFPKLPEGLSALERSVIPRLKTYRLGKFCDQIVGLIETSRLAEVEARIVEAIERFASEPLRSAARIDAQAVRISGWSEFCANVLRADTVLIRDQNRRLALAQLDLSNRQSEPDLELDYRFYADFNHEGRIVTLPGDWAHIGATPRMRIAGLEPVMAVQRAPRPMSLEEGSEAQHQFDIDYRLAGVLLEARIHFALDHYLAQHAPPLPISLHLRINPSRPDDMDSGVLDTHSRRLVAEPDLPSLPPDVVAERLRDLQAAEGRDFQQAFSVSIAELREIYRLVRMYPFYRFRGRQRLGELLTNHLLVLCTITNSPENGVGWQMSKRDFELLLRRFAEAQRPVSVEEALDVRHVNRLHEQWLTIAEAHHYDLSGKTDTLFGLMLAGGLKFGGPIVQQRWKDAPSYVV